LSVDGLRDAHHTQFTGAAPSGINANVQSSYRISYVNTALQEEIGMLCRNEIRCVLARLTKQFSKGNRLLTISVQGQGLITCSFALTRGYAVLIMRTLPWCLPSETGFADFEQIDDTFVRSINLLE
jgi:hypothetical protein